jgi:omega-6 fatty acid desaturase (delta-12 desaturase)
LCLFHLRALVLMHECGHGSLFRTRWLNPAFGFFFGVLSGMPQYVWSRHHDFHHANNGNWEKYRGPLTTLSVDEYQAMTQSQQQIYKHSRNFALAPFGGFVYLVFNPRFTWLKERLPNQKPRLRRTQQVLRPVTGNRVPSIGTCSLTTLC